MKPLTRHKILNEVIVGRLCGLCSSAFRVCLYQWYDDWFGWCVTHVGSFFGGGFPHPCRVAHLSAFLSLCVLALFILAFCVIL